MRVRALVDLRTRPNRVRCTATRELYPRWPRAARLQKFYSPLAIGAPEPYRALPVRLERMIHFVPPHNEKIRAKIKDIAGQVDVVLGNLEDAIPADQKEAARATASSPWRATTTSARPGCGRASTA